MTTKYTNFKAKDVIETLQKQESESIIDNSGVGNTHQFEIAVKPLQTELEKVIGGRTNAFIILGNDRVGGDGSGNGGKGGQACATIDLVAGLMGARPIDYLNGKQQLVPKDFEYDAARIYISQRTNIDEHLGIPKIVIPLERGNYLPTMLSDDKSAIALKADCLRMIARDNIIIGTTAIGVVADGSPAHPNGIDIIANYNDINGLMANLQPMVKGNNLANLIVELIDKINKLHTNLIFFIDEQQQINNYLSTHTHILENSFCTKQPFLVKEMCETFINIIQNETKHHIDFEAGLEILKKQYLTPSSTKYINSVYNRVN